MFESKKNNLKNEKCLGKVRKGQFCFLHIIKSSKSIKTPLKKVIYSGNAY